MVRTERLSCTANRDAMVQSETVPGVLTAQDLQAFTILDEIAGVLDAGDMVEYWKSAPYILNLMDRYGYKIKEKFVQASKDKVSSEILINQLLSILNDRQDTLLSWSTIRSYQSLEPGNAKLRTLLAHTVARGSWQLLWIPPSLPYYQPVKGPFVDPALKDFSKTLVFSSWQIVPKMISSLCSYEAERCMVTTFPDHIPDYKAEREKREGRLVFNMEKTRPASMSTLVLLYPCLTLATELDPLTIGTSLIHSDKLPSLDQLVVATESRIKQLLAPIIQPYTKLTGRDERWYWAALVLLDQHYHYRTVLSWLELEEDELSWWGMVAGRTENESATSFSAHLDLLYEYFTKKQGLGRPPDDLEQVLAKIALASSATTALRALLRFCPNSKLEKIAPDTLAAAAKIALGFRTMFNLPDAITLIRSLHTDGDTRYWESVLKYSLNGNLQAVLDEYMHVLFEALGLMDKPPDVVVKNLAEEIRTAVSIRTVNLNFDDIKVGDKIELDTRGLRCRFALRFGNDRTEDDKDETRADQVRIAFNSPFAPFILATTSIGQEGLDFHQYCHQIYHWNLPSNPVDLEQREGRIHRYKGHVIRRNIVLDFPLSALAGKVRPLDDPWRILFDLAREAHSDQNDLVPYWIFEPRNGRQAYKVQRYIPALPLSRDNERLEHLRHTLVAYRMVFGQPRQEDLVNYLQTRMGRELDPDELLQYRIDLSPMSWWQSGP